MVNAWGGVLFLLAGLVSCTPPLSFRLWNNTDADLQVVGAEATHEWRAGTPLVLGDEGRDQLAWHELEPGGPRYPLIVVLRDGARLEYSVFSGKLSAEFRDFRLGPEIYTLQLQPDGKLYAILPDQALPAEPPRQPEGWPLRPLNGVAAE
jgi:hypothetical protein